MPLHRWALLTAICWLSAVSVPALIVTLPVLEPATLPALSSRKRERNKLPAATHGHQLSTSTVAEANALLPLVVTSPSLAVFA